ncbi:YKE2 [Sanghuangporus weigelae]
MSSLEARLQDASAAYQKLQAELAAAVEARQKLDAQLTETSAVKKACNAMIRIGVFSNTAQEFATLKPGNTVYKLTGPVLVPQDQAEAKANVDKRLDFIRNELKRMDAQIKDISEKSDKRRAEIVEIQTAHQASLQQKGGAGAPVSVS